MKKLTRIGAAFALGASLTTGLAAAQQATVDTTGPDSEVEISAEMETNYDVENNTSLTATNNNPQMARTGDVSADSNTEVDGGGSGDAMNDGSMMGSISVNNSSASDGAGDAFMGAGEGQNVEVMNTGPDSEVEVDYEVEMDVDITNNTDIEITNNNRQHARSGDVDVTNNTMAGGDFSSGDASNSSSVEFTFDITN